MKDVYIFTHIPKTAGTTLRIYFQKHLNQIEFIHFSKKGRKMVVNENLSIFSERSRIERNKAKVILGHDVDKNTKYLVQGKNPIEIVFFRDPNNWEISRYNQYANNKRNKNTHYVSFKDWLNIEKIHSQFDWYLINYCKIETLPKSMDEKYKVLKQNLLDMSYVLFVEKFEKSIKEILKELGTPQPIKRQNITGKGKKMNLFLNTPKNKRLLEWINKDEIEIYKRIKNKFDRFQV